MTRFRSDLNYSDVTRHADFLNRRQLMAGVAGVAAMGAMASPGMAALDFVKSPLSTDDKITSQEAATTYNNFYEFGLGKDDPARNAHKLTIDPWSIEIGGLVDKPGKYSLEDVLTGVQLEERIYRFRCVEAWSMVVPWIGFELKTLLDRVGVQSGGKYVAFETLERPSEMSGQNNPSFPWPYIEGLRMDEAMNPLTILSTGMYGEELPKQNGAPIRLVVPWKYGFKSIKSIVKITVLDNEPPTTWNNLAAREYGFYANVNPEVDHPRWSQASHRPIGSGLFAKREPTQMFNGYTEQVADMYKDMDLKRKF